MYEQEYSNVKLDTGTVLSIIRVTVKLTCPSASGKPLGARNQEITEEYTFGSGHFVAGEDFAEGVYDIIAVDGYGNVSSDKLTEGINAIMGTEDNDIVHPDKVVKNVRFTKGTTLSVSRVSVKLVPSK